MGVLFNKKYQDDYPEKLIRFMTGGFSFYAFGAEILVGKTTLDTWLKDHEEFKGAREIGDLLQFKFYERNQALGSTGATATAKIDGKEVLIKPNPVFNNFALSRLFKKFGYTEKIVTEEIGKASKLEIIYSGGEKDVTLEPSDK